MSYVQMSTEDFLAIPVSGNSVVIKLKNPQVIRMANIDILFESITHNAADTEVLIQVLKHWNPKNYTSGFVARTTAGRPTQYYSSLATSWDCYGILLKHSTNVVQADRIAQFLEQHRSVKSTTQSLITFGDDKSFEEVRHVFEDSLAFLIELSQRQITLTPVGSHQQ